MKRILFVGLRSLGDMVLSMTAVQAVKDSCPDSEIDYVMERPFAPLFAEETIFRSVIPLPRPDGKSVIGRRFCDMAYLQFLKKIRSARYDAVFDLFSRGPRSRIIVAASGAKRRVGVDSHSHPILDRSIYTDRISLPNALTHMSDQMLHIVGRLGFATTRTLPELTVRPENVGNARTFLGPFFESCPKGFYIVFPGSGMPNKNWPTDHYVQLVRALLERGYGILALGGPSDAQALFEVTRRIQTDTPRFRSFFQSDLTVLKGLISLSKGVIGNDSGPVHLSQAVGRKVLALFGPGDHVSYRPFRGMLLRSDLGCSPCQTFGHECPDNACMRLITVERVLKGLESLEQWPA